MLYYEKQVQQKMRSEREMYLEQIRRKELAKLLL